MAIGLIGRTRVIEGTLLLLSVAPVLAQEQTSTTAAAGPESGQSGFAPTSRPIFPASVARAGRQPSATAGSPRPPTARPESCRSAGRTSA